MYLDPPVSMWLPSPWPAMTLTLTFDLQNAIRSSWGPVDIPSGSL